MHRRLPAPFGPNLAVCALLLAALLVAPAVRTARDTGNDGSAVPAAGGTTLPDALLPRVNASFAADNPVYAVAAPPDDATTLHATNPAHRLTTTFAPDGVTFTGERGSRWTLNLATVGDDAMPTVAPLLMGNRVEYRRGNVTEWYVNGPLGVEQGFTLAAPPNAGDALTLMLNIGGAFPYLDAGAVTLTMPDGGSFAYGHLLVMDATGRQLPARLGVTGDAISITADVAGAVYPVTVDPLVEKRLTASDGAAFDAFGNAVAMSGDGTKVVVGTPHKKIGANTNQGAAYIYSGVNYGTETKLTASDGAANDGFGVSVAMSSDGATVIVGAYQKTIGANSQQGAAYVYRGANYGVAQRLTASDGAANDDFGDAVAMSSDGTRVIIGALYKQIGANHYQGAAYVYRGTNYATEMKLTASDGAGGDLFGDYFGDSVAMSADGTKVVVAASAKTIGANTNQGAAYVYSGANYGTETKLTASDGATYDNFGASVAMSSDGAKVIVGASSKQIGMMAAQGAAYIYSGVNYATAQRVTANDGAANDEFGGSVAISGDGTMVIIGAYDKQIGANFSQGAAYLYSVGNYGIAQRLTATDGATTDLFGTSVAMSGDGARVIVGASSKGIGTNSQQGAAYVYSPLNANPLPPAKPPGSPSGNPGPAPAPKPGTGTGNPNPLPPRRP